MPDGEPHDLHTFMAQVTDEMTSEYQRIYARTSQDPGTAGDEGEENWATLFREWLPPTYHIATKGQLIGHDGQLSPQVDVLVLKPSYPRKLREKKIWLASGVIAAFECKNTINASHVADAVGRCVRFKRLYATRTGSPRHELRSPLIFGLLAHSHSWKGPNSTPIENVNRSYESASAAAAHPRELIDLICVADLAVWSSMYLAYMEASWSPQQEPRLRAAYEGDWGVTTSLVCAARDPINDAANFRPIGGLLGHLTQLIAWDDPAVRDIADYYRLANLWGGGKGTQRPWPASVYSESVRARVSQGHTTNGVNWSDWEVGGT